MGNELSKKKIDKIIMNGKKITLPADHTLINILSYNISLKSVITLDDKINEIGNLFLTHKADIICIQNIIDTSTLISFIKKLKTYCLFKKIDIFYAPNFDYIECNKLSSENITNFNQIYNSSINRKNYNRYSDQTARKNKRNSGTINKKLIHNIILSKYPIEYTFNKNLDNFTDIDNILGVQTITGAVINIKNTKIVIYCINLTKDIRVGNINNNKIRTSEMDEILDIINKSQLKNKIDDIVAEFIVGSININEFNNDELNSEFSNFIQSTNTIDLYRLMNPNITENSNGYTNSVNERLNYMMLLNDKSIDFTNKSYNEIQNLIYTRYKILLLNSNIIIHENLTNYIINLLFAINTGKKNENKNV